MIELTVIDEEVKSEPKVSELKVIIPATVGPGARIVLSPGQNICSIFEILLNQLLGLEKRQLKIIEEIDTLKINLELKIETTN